MMISAIFLVVCICTLYSSTITINAGVVLQSNNASATVSNAEESLDASNYLSFMQHKFNTLTNTLNQIDGSLQNLKEQAHTWAIFKHHIDAWNENMRTFEQKLDLVKRTQDEHQAFGNKLLSLEFTLNHILSKVVYLSDNCGSNSIPTSIPDKAAVSIEYDAKPRENNQVILKALDHVASADKKFKNEISTRLSNILRHVQNIESDNCHRHKHVDSASPSSVANDNKMAKLMLPIASCNVSHNYKYNIEQTLKALESKVDTLAPLFTQKDIKQMNALAKKNSKNIEDILNYVSQTDQQLIQCQDEIRDHGNEQCQAVSRELSTFTESSDILLKRVELLVHDVNEKLGGVVTNVNANEFDTHVQDGNKVPNNDDGDDNDGLESIDEAAKTNTKQIPEENNHVNSDIDEVVAYVQPEKIACHELVKRQNGIYKLSTPELNDVGRDFNERFCVFATHGPAWTVIQNRGPYEEQENFNRSWADYKAGFGLLHKDFWLGNEFIHQLVYRDDYELRIELENFEGVQKWAEYSIFRLDSERYNYNLLIGGYSGTLVDSLSYHNEMDFSTYDRRNDNSVDACCSCATGYASGWWFNNCSEANLNGVYHNTPLTHNYVGIVWESWLGDYSLKRTRMMIRPKTWTSENTHEVYHEFTEDP